MPSPNDLFQRLLKLQAETPTVTSLNYPLGTEDPFTDYRDMNTPRLAAETPPVTSLYYGREEPKELLLDAERPRIPPAPPRRSVQYPGGTAAPFDIPPPIAPPPSYPPTPGVQYFGADGSPGIPLDRVNQPMPPRTVPPMGQTPTADAFREMAKAPQTGTVPPPTPRMPTPSIGDLQSMGPKFNAPEGPPLEEPLERPPEMQPPSTPSIRENVRNYISSKDWNRFSEAAGRGLGRIGRGMIATQGTLVEPAEEEPSLYALEEEDRIPQSVVDTLAKSGIQIDPEMGMSRFKAVMPLLAQQLGVQSRTQQAAEAAQAKQAEKQQALTFDLIDDAAKERNEWLKPTSEVGQIREKLRTIKDVKALLTTGKANSNPPAVRTAITRIAKGLAEDDRLSDQDIAGYEGLIGIPGFFDSTQKLAIGNYSPRQIQMLQQIADSLYQVATSYMTDYLKGRVESFKNTYAEKIEAAGMDPESLGDRFGLSDFIGEEQQSTPVAPDTPGLYVPPGMDITKHPLEMIPTISRSAPQDQILKEQDQYTRSGKPYRMVD